MQLKALINKKRNFLGGLLNKQVTTLVELKGRSCFFIYLFFIFYFVIVLYT